ncbi:MAG: hypothetical protein ACO36B_06180 [Methylophilaceae bacterium]|jgi:hypothetical protein
MEILNPDYPDGFFPLKLLGKQLGYEVSSLKSICKKLSIEVSSIDRQTYISIDAKPILEQAVIAEKGGAAIDYSKVSTTTKVIPQQKVKTDAPQAAGATGLVVRDGAGAGASTEQFFQVLMEVVKQQQQVATPISPIQQQRELKDAADNGFLLSAEQLSNIFGLKKSSISSWKTGHRRLGFQFTKIKENNISLWKVEQY